MRHHNEIAHQEEMETMEQFWTKVQQKDETLTVTFNKPLHYHFEELHCFRLPSSLQLADKIIIISYQMLVFSVKHKVVQALY